MPHQSLLRAHVYAGSWSNFSGGGIVGAFSLSGQTPVLSVSPLSLSYSAFVGGANPAPKTAIVSNTGIGTLNFTASSDSAWLSVSPTYGVAPQTLQVSANITGLGAGSYNRSHHCRSSRCARFSRDHNRHVDHYDSSAAATGSFRLANNPFDERYGRRQ